MPSGAGAGGAVVFNFGALVSAADGRDCQISVPTTSANTSTAPQSQGHTRRSRRRRAARFLTDFVTDDLSDTLSIVGPAQRRMAAVLDFGCRMHLPQDTLGLAGFRPPCLTRPLRHDSKQVPVCQPAAGVIIWAESHGRFQTRIPEGGSM